MIEGDVLIIGSGPTGVSAARPLVEAGLSVVMVDAGNPDLPAPPKAEIATWRRDPQHWRDMLGDDLGALAISGDFSPKFRTPLGRAVLAAGDALAPALNINNVIAARSASPGGLSSIWGAFCTAFNDDDMRGFAIAPTDLAAGYRAIAERIGISGANDDLADFHGIGGWLQKPHPLTPPAQHVLRRYAAISTLPGFRLGGSRNAVLTQDSGERKGCVQCGLCLYGCAHGSIYDSRFDLCNLQKFKNFRYYAEAPVQRLLAAGGERQRVELQLDGQTVVGEAKAVVLAAGTINSTALALDYFKAFDTKIRLLTNPVAASIPHLVGADFLQKTFGLGQLSYRLALPDNSYAAGVFYGADTLSLNVFASRMPFSRPTALRLSAALMPSLLLATSYLPGSYSANSLSFTRNEARGVVMLEGTISTQTKEMLKQAGKGLGRGMGRLGAYPVPLSFTISPPGSDAHFGGTLPMGGEGKLSCSRDCELENARGVSVVDGSWLPSLPAKHLTFTLMANAHRVGSAIAKRMGR